MPVKHLKRVIFLLFCLLVMQGVRAQVTIFTETMGSGGSNGVSIATWESNNYFDNDSYTMSGTGDMRNTSASSGYTDASGTWNVMLNSSTEYFQIADINCSSYSSIVISIGIRKSTTAENGSTLAIQVSSDGTNWTNLSYSLPTGTGTATWHLVTPTGSIPSASNLRIKFTSSSTVEFRIDDIVVKGIVASCNAPTAQVQNITGIASGAQSMVVNWTNGNGNGRIIKINTSNSFTNPVDGVDNPGNPVYAGSGEQIIYNGSGNNVTVTGLEPCVTYWVRAYEYNCSGTNIKYNVATAANNPASVSITTVGGGTTTLASENFEGTTNWAYTHIASIVGTGGGGVSSLTIKPAPFGFSNSKALVKSHTADNNAGQLSSIEEVTFDQISIPAGSTGINLSFRIASLNSTGGLVTGLPSNDGAGHDADDYFQLQINLNNSTWNTCFTQYGNSNFLFPYLPEVALSPTWNQNANLTTPSNQYNKFNISIPDGTTSVTLKYFLRNNRLGENWCLDEMLLQATTPGVNTLPAVFTIIGNSSFCAGSSGTLISLSGSETGVSYQLYLNGNPVGSPVAGTGSAINFGFQNQAGTYTVIATNSTYTNCQSTMTPSLVVTITPAPTAIAGPLTPHFCVLTFMMKATQPSVGVGTWTEIPPIQGAIIVSPHDPHSIVNVPANGTYNFRWTVSNPPCSDSYQDISVMVSNSPEGFAHCPSSVCEGSYLDLTCDIGGALSYIWFDPNYNQICTNQNCSVLVDINDGGWYKVEVNSVTCGIVLDSCEATIVATPAAPSSITVTPSGICDNYAGSVTLDAIGGSGDIEWYQGICSGTPIGNSDPWIINSPPSVTTNYFARYTNAGCVSACTMGTLTVSPQPAADAGVPQSICGSMSTVLAANNPSPNTGVWTIVSGPGSVTFANNALYNTSVSVDQYGEYILRWTVSNALCGSVSDEVKINFSSTVTANANWDSPVCEGSTLHLYCDIGGATYSWTGPNSFASGVQNPVINNVSLAARGLYQVNVSAIPGGCPATSAQTSVYISAAPAEPASVTVDRPVVCAGDGFINLQCSGGSGDIVQWYAGSCGSAVIGTGATLTLPAPSGTTNYFAAWHSDTCGNSVCEQTTVQVYDPPSSAIAGTDQSLCNVFTTYLAATPPVSGTGTWTEDPGNPFPVTIFNVNSATSQIQVPAFGIYKLIWTVSNGVCAPNSQTVQIEFGNNIQVTAQANTPVCEGGTLNLSSSISGATTYSWTGPNGFSSNVISPSVPNVTSANAGDYHLFVNGIPGGCPDSDDLVNVQVSPVPNAPMVVSDGLSGDLQSVCETSSVIYTINSPVPGSTYIWSLDGGGTVYPLSTSDSVQVNWYSGSGTYKITVSESSNAGCSGNAADVNVSVIAQFEPMASVLLNPNPLCEGSMLSLNLATNVPALDALYSWFKNDELIAGTKEFTTEEVADGDEFYSVVMVNSDCSAQPMVTTDKIVLTVLPRPAISIIPSGDLCSGTQITLSASDSYPVYLWQDGSITSSTIVNAFGSYWLRITDADNCSNADTLAIEPCEVENAVLIPNAFSPNGDFNNDIFRVIFSDPDKILRFNMTIYNKWGNLVFESNRATIGWNGYLKNGEPAPGDMYTYSVTYRYKDNPDVKNRKQGLLTLLR